MMDDKAVTIADGVQVYQRSDGMYCLRMKTGVDVSSSVCDIHRRIQLGRYGNIKEAAAVARRRLEEFNGII